MKQILFLLIAAPFLACAQQSDDDFLRADNSRSDTIDITDYNINLNITDFTGHVIGGHCIISFKSKMDNINQLYLDLQNLTVDSVTQNNQSLTFSYNNILLITNLLSPLNTNDSTQVTVYYHGVPDGDGSGWGGFYFSGVYAFNLGVGFAADPHNYGRVWFPCFDNFVERSTFHFSITTSDTDFASCNGELISGIDNGNGTKTWNWQMLQTIPSYLACVAVSDYTPVHQVYNGLQGAIPILLCARASDTTHMKNSFIHLPVALNAFETSWGPYQWNKVGYSAVPFSSGAMEHATNISYPLVTLNGNTTYESIMVHELSHHWFGDLVTCKTAEDMWLNEGWAVYNEHIFQEFLNGEQGYKDAVALNHEQVLHLAHITDGQYFPVSGVPHDYTYGTTVYNKGADMAHTLRGYMGDSLFFHCMTNYLNDKAFTAESSSDLRDYLTNCSGIDLNSYFNDWIFSPGWAAFTIDSFESEQQGSNYYVTVHLHQRLNHAPHLYSNVPLEITFMDAGWNKVVKQIMMSGKCESYSLVIPINPVYVGVDLDDKISDAVTADTKVVMAVGSNIFNYGKMSLNINTVPDSAFIRIEHYFAPPDPFKNPVPNLHISQYRYWKVDGIIPSSFDASATIYYNGMINSSGYLDNDLITNVEDSLVMLYRSSPRYDWSILTDLTQNFLGNNNNKFGVFTINHLQKGEYALAIYQHNKIDSALFTGSDSCVILSAPQIPLFEKGSIEIFPNPANENVTVNYHGFTHEMQLDVFDIWGRKIFTTTLSFPSQQKIISVGNWQRGMYFFRVKNSESDMVKQLMVLN